MNWHTGDGPGVMVIGREKREQIRQKQLLQWYFEEIFEDVLYRPNRRLLVIGYGFRDAHVNAAITQAIRQHGLKMYVISPQNPRHFESTLPTDSDEDEENKRVLWQGLAGYWDLALKDIYPGHQTRFAEEIRKAIFQQ